MINLILLSIVFLFIFSSNFKKIENNSEIFISNYITSLTLSISLIGSISLLLIFIGSVKFPLILITLFIFLSYFLLSNTNSNQVTNFFKSCKVFFNTFLGKENANKYIIFLLFYLYLLSFGPINHPDATTTYVGYPYQFFIKGKHFIDGGLFQGILGISDFANLAFFQEKSIWLIRTIQAIPIFFIVSIFLTRDTNRLLIISFLTTPVFIQWLTIGKFLFFPDLAVTITYLVWDKYRTKNNLINLFILIVLSISFKITTLIICTPILLHIIFYLISTKKFKSFLYINNNSRYLLLFFAFVILIEILLYRFYVTGNFLYPLFNNLFIPDNQQMIDFENILKKYLYSDGLPFITTNINLLGMTLGPANSLLIIFLPILSLLEIKENRFIKYNLVPITQLILLLFLSNGRADYFAAPLIIILISTKIFNFKNYFFKNLSKVKFNYFKNIFLFILWLQILIFSCITLISIYQSISGILNYQSSMSRYAYNYDLSKTINKVSEEPIINFYDRTPLLFLKKDYIHEDKFKNCLNYSENKSAKDSIENCFRNFEAKSIITNSDALKNNKSFVCKKYTTNYTSRNPFKFRKRSFDLCNITDLEY